MPLTAIELFKKDIKKKNRQRSFWLIFSIFTIIVILTTTFFWDFLLRLHSSIIWWTIGISGIALAVIWWWWTMSLINNIIWHQYQMIEILKEITNDINYVKQEVSYLRPES